MYSHSSNSLIPSLLAIFFKEVRLSIRTKKTVCYIEVLEFVLFTGCYYALYICKKKKIMITIQIYQKRLFWGLGIGCMEAIVQRAVKQSDVLCYTVSMPNT